MEKRSKTWKWVRISYSSIIDIQLLNTQIVYLFMCFNSRRFSYASGDLFEGQYTEDKRSGFGISRYHGELFNGRYHNKNI